MMYIEIMLPSESACEPRKWAGTYYECGAFPPPLPPAVSSSIVSGFGFGSQLERERENMRNRRYLFAPRSPLAFSTGHL